MDLLTAFFDDNHKAGKAYNFALKLGYIKEEINILMSEETRRRHEYEHKDTEPSVSDEAIKGAGVGGALGVTTGAFIGAAIAMGTIIATSGLSLVISGPIAVGLAGATAGGLAGGLVGAMINAGISEDYAKNYLEEITKGSILIAIIPHSEEDRRTLETEWQAYEGIILGAKK